MSPRPPLAPLTKHSAARRAVASPARRALTPAQNQVSPTAINPVAGLRSVPANPNRLSSPIKGRLASPLRPHDHHRPQSSSSSLQRRRLPLPPPATAEPPLHCPSTRIEVGLGTSEAQWCSSPSSWPPPPLWITDPGPPPPAAAGRCGRATPGRHGLSRGRESTPQSSLALFPLPRSRLEP